MEVPSAINLIAGLEVGFLFDANQVATSSFRLITAGFAFGSNSDLHLDPPCVSDSVASAESLSYSLTSSGNVDVGFFGRGWGC